jgi:Fanconi anemia group M protein
MSCISHPLIKPDSLESREYQLSIAMKALDE